MLMVDENLKKESIMTKEDQELFIDILPEPYKNTVMYYLNEGYSYDALLTIALVNFKRTPKKIKTEIHENIINQLFELIKKYNLDTSIEFKPVNIQKSLNTKKEIQGETIKTKYNRGQKLEREINGNKIQYEIRGMCINIRDEQIAKDIMEEQIEVLYNVYQNDSWIATVNEKRTRKKFYNIIILLKKLLL